MIKNILTTLILLFSINAFAQTTMTVHTPSGSTDYLLSDIDSITYNTPGGGGGSGTTVGGNGPAGGIVFYDKGSYSNGWRYLEMTENDLNQSEWGCEGTSIGSTLDIVGSGEDNTNAIIASCSTPGTAAKICFNYSISNAGTIFDDWFLPSIEELNLIYNAAQNYTVIYNAFLGSVYWSSTEYDMDIAWTLISAGGGTFSNNYGKQSSYSVKAIRKF